MNSRAVKWANFATTVAAAAAVLFSNSAMAASFRVLAADGGETVTVTTLEDVSDFSGLQQVSDLPGPDGRVSFREAVTAANNTPGPQTIAFAIPTSEFWLVPDVALLKLEQDAFFLNDSGTTVDFSTQTVNIGDTNPNGPEVGIYGLQPNGWGIAAIFLNGDNCVVKGLGKVYQRGYAVRMVGNNNHVIGCQIDGPLHAAVSVSGYMGWPAPSGNIVGGTEPGEGNSLIGLVIDGPAEGNIVIGNTLLIGVEVRGATQFGVIARNNRIGGPTPAERNVIAGAGSYGEEGFPSGAQISIVDADGTIVEGNYIGTTADGMARYPQQIGPVGVEIYDSRTTTVRANLIAGLRTVGLGHYSGQIFGQAVHVGAINSNTQDTVIEGNTIGLAADGVTPIATRSGITVSPFTSFYHAFSTLITSNRIASVETTGVFVADLENGVTITRNSIHDCGGLGIDLYPSGPTLNDPGDGDTGANGLQNFPVLLSATTTGSAVTVQGTLDSSPSAQFTVEFFANPSCDPSGFGEGAAFIGSILVTTDSAGHATFSLPLPASVAVGSAVTATATRLSTGDTSEFSACIAVTSDGLPVANVTALSLAPSSVYGSKTSIGTVTISSAAPAGGTPVTLSSNKAEATAPGLVVVNEGQTQATFTVTTTPVAAQVVATISATLGVTKTKNLTIKPPAMSKVSFSPTWVYGGFPSTGTVTLTGTAAVDTVVTLSSNAAEATVPASVTVLAGHSTATFTANTVVVYANAIATVTGTFNGVSKSANLTVKSNLVYSVSLTPTTVTGGSSSAGKVTLTSAAGPGGVIVTLSSDKPDASVPPSVTVLAGQKTANFTVNTTPVGAQVPATISGSVGASTRSKILTINP